MELEVIGSASPFPMPDNPCSGYLLMTGGNRVLLECGSGVLLSLAARVAPYDLDAVVISHWHGDHMSDLLVLKYGIMAARQVGKRTRPLTVFCPAEPQPMLDLVSYGEAVVTAPLHPGIPVDVCGITVTPFAADHPGPALALRLERGGRTLFYTGDTGPGQGMRDAARGADVLLSEATYEARLVPSVPGHLSGLEAGALAEESGCGQLVVTHVTAFSDPVGVLAEARTRYGGPIALARPGLRVTVSN